MSKKMKSVISRRKRLGSIAEIQSFVLEEAPSSTTTGPQKKRYERANSVLRLNLGNHLYCSEKVVLQASNFQKRKFGSGINKLQNVKGFQGLRHLAGRRNAVAPDLQHDAHHLVPGTVDLSEGDTVLVCLAKLPSSSDMCLPTVYTPVLHAFPMLKTYANRSEHTGIGRVHPNCHWRRTLDGGGADVMTDSHESTQRNVLLHLK